MRHLRKLCSTPVAFVTLLALGACAEDSDEAAPPDESAMEAEVEVDGTTGPAFSEEVRTEFSAPEGSDSQARGTLRLLVPVREAEDDDMRLRVELAGLTPGEHAWHIHAGPCGVDAPIEIPLSAPEGEESLAEPLTAGEDGTVVTEVAVPPLDQRWVEAGSYSVHVHRSTGAEHGPTVACATL